MSYAQINKRFVSVLERFADTRFAQWLIGVWAFLEASVWFIAPDLLLIPLAVARPRKWLRFVLIALGASILGGVFYALLISFNPVFWESVLRATPFVKQYMFDYASARYDSYGAAGVLWQSFSLFSFKIWTYLAYERGFSWWLFFVFAAVSRFARFAIGSGAAALVGSWLRPFLRRHAVACFGAFVAGFVTLILVVE